MPDAAHDDTIHLAPPHPAAIEPEALLAQCSLTKSRTSGPGGQHRNKVETGVTLHHRTTGIEGHAGERRSVEDNKRAALRRLRLNLAVRVRTPVPDGEVRSALWRSRCSDDGRIACNPEHADFPALVAEALDVIWSAGGDVRKAGARLCCSTSQLVKLLKDHPPALARLNSLRAAHGKHELR